MTIAEIKKEFDKEYQFDIYKKDQKRRSVYARKTFTYLCRQLNYTYEHIAELIGVKHDNAIYYNNSIHTISDMDKRIYNKIAKKLNCNVKLFKVKEVEVNKNEFKGNLSAFNELLELGDDNVRLFIETRLKPYLRMNKIKTESI